jgi:hypothetical protein
MARQKAAEPIRVLDPLPVTLELMGALAVNVLGEHTDGAGLGVVRGSAWPCERVVLAAHNLALI